MLRLAVSVYSVSSHSSYPVRVDPCQTSISSITGRVASNAVLACDVGCGLGAESLPASPTLCPKPALWCPPSSISVCAENWLASERTLSDVVGVMTSGDASGPGADVSTKGCVVDVASPTFCDGVVSELDRVSATVVSCSSVCSGLAFTGVETSGRIGSTITPSLSTAGLSAGLSSSTSGFDLLRFLKSNNNVHEIFKHVKLAVFKTITFSYSEHMRCAEMSMAL